MHANDRAANVSTILRDPRWLAHRYDPGHDAVHFLQVNGDILRRATFLIDRELPSDLATIVLGRQESMAAAPAAAPMHFIFHSAYCCSTLLARAFDHPGLATSLREPTILNDLTGWRRQGVEASQVSSVTDDVLRLLARPSAPDERVIVKPSNIVNAMAPAILRSHPECNALLLHAPLRIYLASIIRKGMWGSLWVREHLRGALQDGIVHLGFDRDDFLGQTDLQIAAMGWLAQHRLFQGLVRQFGPGRVRTIDSETLLAHRTPALAKLAALFGLAIEPRDIQAIAEGPIFARHSKSAAPYDAHARRMEQENVPGDRIDELDKVMAWSEAVARTAGIPMVLGASLLD